MNKYELSTLGASISTYRVEDSYQLVISPFATDDNKFELRIFCKDLNKWFLLQIPLDGTNFITEKDNE